MLAVSQMFLATRSRNASNNSRGGGPGLKGSRMGSYQNMKQEIKEYISTKSPSWFKRARTRVAQFTNVLERHYPRYRAKLMRRHRNPFKNLALSPSAYVSLRNGSFILRKRVKPNMPRSWSLIDTAEFGRRRKNLVRCNSFDALTGIEDAEVKKPEVMLGAKMRDVGLSVGTTRDGMVTDDELDEEYAGDSDAFSDFNYVGEFDSALVDDLIDKYMNPQSKDPENQPATENSIIDNEENKSGTFSMQDVMELTLLHAQQMHLMQKEYEDRIRTQDIQLEVMKQTLEDAEQDFESKMKQANERAQRLAQKYVTAGGFAEETARAAEGKGKNRGKNDGSSSDDDESENGEDVHGKLGGKFTEKDGKAKVKKKVEKKGGFDASRLGHKQSKPPVDKPVIKLSSHEHTFMERLRWFTDERLKKMKELEDKFIAPEIAANEERLNQLKLIRRHKNIIEDSEFRDAEFVPHPGQVPVHRMKKAWAEHYAKAGVRMPWIGRFQAMNKWGDKPNITRINPTKRYSDAVIHNGTVHLVEVANDGTQPFRNQVSQCLSQIETTLSAVGSDKNHLLQVLIFVKNLGDVPVLNELWDEWLNEGHAPSRACVQANMVHASYLIEFVVTAAAINSTKK
ncbi:hypothetical protein HK100_006616 [Physocladia obscura]|uniref:Uncharacterized protein n=1 Tax=Physocladia obscura TaxID=109957 RepID=A0AAD5SQB4_9FUNG|nr:hypothetical protein HK100_006616 [Physocladia obscura]